MLQLCEVEPPTCVTLRMSLPCVTCPDGCIGHVSFAVSGQRQHPHIHETEHDSRHAGMTQPEAPLQGLCTGVRDSAGEHVAL